MQAVIITTFNVTLDRTCEVFPGLPAFTVHGAASQNSALGSGQLRLVAGTYASGAFIPELNDRSCSFSGTLAAGRSRLDIISSQNSNGGSFFG